MQEEFVTKVKAELNNILDYWQKNAPDTEHGGFLGRIDHFGKTIPESPKGIILNTRILWAFSAASNYFADDRYKSECERAYSYVMNHFKDTSQGGVFWELDYLGNPVNRRKQVYAQAFTIYALAEYYKYGGQQEVLSWAMELFQLVETHALDLNLEGYIEAFAENWDAIEDMRLSEKDLNAPKTMNTHLHILEAYTTLYEVKSDIEVGKALENLIHLFLEKFASKNNHFKLFLSNDWKNLSSEASYGHDIEAVWLLVIAARTLKNVNLTQKTEALAVKVADIFIKEALDDDFGVFNAIDLKTGKLDADKHWWPPAEAIVGLLYVSKITKDKRYTSFAKKLWRFIDDTIIDHDKGEWFFRVNRQGVPYTDENKLGPWKCPYHNSRACMEIIKLLD
ncbi:mannobiose 2-epimerase [Pricia antarctica]|uniref:Cellobiose 2-epimerase n=1 Tax=Pricia antarctica TaxID=641691 RepID=A0A1G7AIU4_9FLAO|nr:AGE family epimerase/isomerase [Pricia antarctica]SDE14749.1 mannobiose 2-epimerase [Pricia antarctica]